MPLTVRPLVESDIRTYVELNRSAFFASNDPNNRTMTPNPPTPESLEHGTNETIKHLKELRNLIFLGCFDSDANDEMIAVARWRVEDEETYKEPLGDHSTPGGNQEAIDEFFERIESVRTTVMGPQKYWHLQLLATSPKHERRGAAGLLLRWAIEQADRDELDMFLIATESGMPVYKKYGWKVVDEIWFDWSQFGEHRPGHLYTMVRQPAETASGA